MQRSVPFAAGKHVRGSKNVRFAVCSVELQQIQKTFSKADGVCLPHRPEGAPSRHASRGGQSVSVHVTQLCCNRARMPVRREERLSSSSAGPQEIAGSVWRGVGAARSAAGQAQGLFRHGREPSFRRGVGGGLPLRQVDKHLLQGGLRQRVLLDAQRVPVRLHLQRWRRRIGRKPILLIHRRQLGLRPKGGQASDVLMLDIVGCKPPGSLASCQHTSHTSTC